MPRLQLTHSNTSTAAAPTKQHNPPAHTTSFSVEVLPDSTAFTGTGVRKLQMLMLTSTDSGPCSPLQHDLHTRTLTDSQAQFQSASGGRDCTPLERPATTMPPPPSIHIPVRAVVPPPLIMAYALHTQYRQSGNHRFYHPAHGSTPTTLVYPVSNSPSRNFLL